MMQGRQGCVEVLMTMGKEQRLSSFHRYQRFKLHPFAQCSLVELQFEPFGAKYEIIY